MARTDLTAQQKLFCIEYVKGNCSNATEAAKQAGYSHNTAMEQSSRLLRNVKIQDEIRRIRGNLEVDLRSQFLDEAKNAFVDLKHMRDDLLTDKVQLVKVLSDGTVVRYKATDTAVLRLRKEINESILDRAGYKAPDNVSHSFKIEDLLKEID